MNKRLTVALICLATCIAACTPAVTAVPPNQTRAEPPTRTNTVAPPTLTPIPPSQTPAPPTRTPTALRTSTATDTVEPTPTVNICGSAPAVAANRKVHLTIINKSGDDVFIEMKNCTDLAFYNLTVPAGFKDDPNTKNFMIFTGAYEQVVSVCKGEEVQRLFVLENNVRLTFTGCGQTPTSTSTP